MSACIVNCHSNVSIGEPGRCQSINRDNAVGRETWPVPFARLHPAPALSDTVVRGPSWGIYIMYAYVTQRQLIFITVVTGIYPRVSCTPLGSLLPNVTMIWCRTPSGPVPRSANVRADRFAGSSRKQSILFRIPQPPPPLNGLRGAHVYEDEPEMFCRP